MNKTLFVSWQGFPADESESDGGEWFPVGRLEADDRWKDRYRFQYIASAERALSSGFSPLPSFPGLDGVYRSDALFQTFQNRVIQPGREDYREYLSCLGIDDDVADPMDILEVSGGRRMTDRLGVFPLIRPSSSGRFSCRFFPESVTRGSIEPPLRFESLRREMPLRLDPPTVPTLSAPSVRLSSDDDSQSLGLLPWNLTAAALAALKYSPGDLRARVFRVNPPPAPANQRVLIALEGKLPPGFQPTSGGDFAVFTGQGAVQDRCARIMREYPSCAVPSNHLELWVRYCMRYRGLPVNLGAKMLANQAFLAPYESVRRQSRAVLALGLEAEPAEREDIAGRCQGLMREFSTCAIPQNHFELWVRYSMRHHGLPPDFGEELLRNRRWMANYETVRRTSRAALHPGVNRRRSPRREEVALPLFS